MAWKSNTRTHLEEHDEWHFPATVKKNICSLLCNASHKKQAKCVSECHSAFSLYYRKEYLHLIVELCANYLTIIQWSQELFAWKDTSYICYTYLLHRWENLYTIACRYIYILFFNYILCRRVRFIKRRECCCSTYVCVSKTTFFAGGMDFRYIINWNWKKNQLRIYKQSIYT